MKYFLIAVVVLFSSNLYAANEGSGPINFSGDFYSGYNYLITLCLISDTMVT